MANVVIKAEQIVRMGLLLLQREIVLPATVWRPADKSDYKYAKNDTVTLSVPAVMEARRRTLRSQTALIFDEFAETSVDVKVDEHLYKGIRVTDENLTLDIKDFGAQVLQPQIRAVAEEYEDLIAETLADAADNSSYDPVDWDAGTDDPYSVALRARKALNDMNVPMNDRFLLLGSNAELAALDSDRFSKADTIGETQAVSALREASLGRKVAGFTVLTSNAVDEDFACAYHRTAVATVAFAPDVPMGAVAGSMVQGAGLAFRYIRDYNPTDEDGPADRSLIDLFAGAQSVDDKDEDGSAATDPTNQRIVKINFSE